MVVGSAFSGIGGFDLGLQRAGHSVAWQIEIDPACQTILRRHFGNRQEPSAAGEQHDGPTLHTDIREIAGELASVDLVCGGFPCQDISVAGRRAGLAGERSRLFFDLIALVAELTPRWILIENPDGLLLSNGGRDMGTVLRELGKLGYWWAYRVLDAQYFGLAQRRHRVFIVGCLGDRLGATQVLFEPESGSGHPAPSRTPQEAVAGTLGGGSGQRGWPDDTDRMTFVPTVAPMVGGGNYGQGNLEEGVPMAIAFRGRREGIAAELGGEVANAVRSGSGSASRGGHVFQPYNIIGGAQQGRNHAYPTDPTGTIQHKGNSASGNEAGTVIQSGAAVRRLTPTECERLQGFPDEWTGGFADSTRYRMIGNAVPPPVAEWIGRRMVAYHTPAMQIAARS